MTESSKGFNSGTEVTSFDYRRFVLTAHDTNRGLCLEGSLLLRRSERSISLGFFYYYFLIFYFLIFLLSLFGGRVLLCGMSNSRSEIGMSVVHVGFKVLVGVRTNVRVILKITGRP